MKLTRKEKARKLRISGRKDGRRETMKTRRMGGKKKGIRSGESL